MPVFQALGLGVFLALARSITFPKRQPQAEFAGPPGVRGPHEARILGHTASECNADNFIIVKTKIPKRFY